MEKLLPKQYEIHLSIPTMKYEVTVNGWHRYIDSLLYNVKDFIGNEMCMLCGYWNGIKKI